VHDALPRHDLDSVPVTDAGPPPAEGVHRQEPVLRYVRHSEADDVEVREEREQRPAAAAAPRRDEVADGIRLDLRDAVDRRPHGGEG
jgi:hypothetical protein